MLIWWLTEPSQLSASGLDLLNTDDAEVLVSVVSAYEIELKRPADPLLQRIPENLVDAVFAEGFDWLVIAPKDAVMAGKLPRHHRDPWDRLLIAQSARNRIPILTKDPAFLAYGVDVIW